MTNKSIVESIVKSVSDVRSRRGRGFSKGELSEAGISTNEARRMGLILDARRRTAHVENVEILKQYQKELERVAASVTGEKATKPTRDASVKELSSLSGITPDEVDLLASAGVKTLSELAYCDIAKVSKKSKIDEDRITSLVKAALKKV